MTGEESATRPPAAPGPGSAHPERGVLHAVAEALQHGRGEDAAGEDADGGTGLAAACREAGRSLAGAGVPLGESLDALAAEWGSVLGCDPHFAAVRAFADAWGDGTLAWLRRLDCTDPLTGLATAAHLRTRVTEVLRGGSPPEGTAPALLVTELVSPGEAAGGQSHPLADALLATRAGAMARAAFPGQTPASLGGARLALLAEDGPAVRRRVRLLEQMLSTIGGPDASVARVHVLPLPDDPAAAHEALDALLVTRAHTGVARGWPPFPAADPGAGDVPDTLGPHTGGEVADTA